MSKPRWATPPMASQVQPQRAPIIRKNQGRLEVSTGTSSDREALVALYHGTSGAKWRRKANWNTPVHLSQWDGVILNDQGRVKELCLSANNLRGPIPTKLGNLKGLTHLVLSTNNLSGNIPKELRALRNLEVLSLGDNKLTGHIPKELRALSKLRALLLQRNMLTGAIPPDLGKLAELKCLMLQRNQLTGGPRANESLRAWKTRLQAEMAEQAWAEKERAEEGLVEQGMTEVERAFQDLDELKLALRVDKLKRHKQDEQRLFELELALHEVDQLELAGRPSAKRDEQEQAEQALAKRAQEFRVEVDFMQRDLQKGGEQELAEWALANRAGEKQGHPEVDELERALQEVDELERTLREYGQQKRALQALVNRAGEERTEQELDEVERSLKERDEQELAEVERGSEEWDGQELAEQALAERSPIEENSRLELARPSAASGGRVPSSNSAYAERFLREQMTLFAQLDELTRKNSEHLEEVKRLLGKPIAGGLPQGADLSNMEKLRELDRLVSMAKALVGLASRYAEDEDTKRKEMSLDLGPREYYAAVRSGLCNAYLAASVVDSGLVSASKVGIMGKAGTALKLMAGAVPVVAGLGGFVGAALEAGDRFVQTRRIVKIVDLAPDVVECCTLARILALRLADGVTLRTIVASYDNGDSKTHFSADVGLRAGRFDSSEGSGALTDGVSEEDAMEWFIEQISNCELSNSGATTGIRESGKRLGTRHLRKLLTAVGQDLLQGASNTVEKVERLLEVIHEAGRMPVGALSPPETSLVRSPVRALTSNGSMDRETILAKLEALELADIRRQKEVEELKSDKDKLQREVASFKKHLPSCQGESGGSVDVGGGQQLAQEQKTKTKEDFVQEMENPARSTNRPVTMNDDPWVADARTEVAREVGHLDTRVTALEERYRGKRKGILSRWRDRR